MKIETLDVRGIPQAMKAMRNPYSNRKDSDSLYMAQSDTFMIGSRDRALSNKLSLRGAPHDKHLRLIQVWADITAPLYWWKQFDTYRAGVEKLSGSTMHTLAKKEITADDFAFVDAEDKTYIAMSVLPRLNRLRELYNAEDDPETKDILWRKLIADLPSSYCQTRTVMMSYAAVRSMLEQRKSHKMREWRVDFVNWVKLLPESEMLTLGVL